MAPAEEPAEVVADVAFELDFVVVAVVAQTFSFETGRVGQIALALRLTRADNAIAQPVGDWAGDREIDVHRLERSRADIELSLELVGRTFRDDVDRAADRVAAVQRALRAAHNLGTLHHDGATGGDGQDRAWVIDAVNIVRHAGTDAEAVRVAVHAADADPVGRNVEGEAGGKVCEVGQRLNADLFAGLGRKRRHGDADVLDGFFPLLRGDHDDVSA